MKTSISYYFLKFTKNYHQISICDKVITKNRLKTVEISSTQNDFNFFGEKINIFLFPSLFPQKRVVLRIFCSKSSIFYRFCFENVLNTYLKTTDFPQFFFSSNLFFPIFQLKSTSKCSKITNFLRF